MRPAPIPDSDVWDGSRRIVIAPPDGDLTSTDIAPVEALIGQAEDGGPLISVRCVLEPGDLDKLAKGGPVWVTFLSPQLVPFAIEIAEP